LVITTSAMLCRPSNGRAIQFHPTANDGGGHGREEVQAVSLAVLFALAAATRRYRTVHLLASCRDYLFTGCLANRLHDLVPFMGQMLLRKKSENPVNAKGKPRQRVARTFDRIHSVGDSASKNRARRLSPFLIV
jgi:hypothetical protein